MNVVHLDHPLKFINEIADQAQRENVSRTLLVIFENEKKSRRVEFDKPKIKEAIKKKIHIPYNPVSFDEWVMRYLVEKAHCIKTELQTYTSMFDSEEKVKTYINQQYSFIKNYHIKNFDRYTKNNLTRGIKSDPLKAGIQLAYNIILQNIAADYKHYLENAKALSPQQTETKMEQETPTFVNNFDNIATGEIYKHFKADLVEKGYLTEQELNEYLKAAFELKAKPKTLFKLKHTPTKQKIYTVFYVYYKDISQKKHERQKEYAALLGDYFEGYKTKVIQTNWARGYKTKR